MPCRKSMAGCRRGCRHRQFVLAYRVERHAAELAAEGATGGYATERREYARDCPLITYRDWLIHNRP